MIFSKLVLVKARFDAMTSAEQISASFHAIVDSFLVIFLLFGVWIGFTSDPYVFFFWVPFLAFVAWRRLGQLRERWNL